MRTKTVKTRMSWKHLLSTKRLNAESDQTLEPRTAFERDWDRLVFSWSFRRMHDKTQVFPLASSDYVRTRLTHTLEVASVGRSLGALVGDWLVDSKSESLDPAGLSGATAAACIAHDIGNPPFGHSGESAIQTWFETSETGRLFRQSLTRDEARDFESFEGNAQAFRLVARLEYAGAGLGLTCATLGAFLKYPRSSDGRNLPERAFFKKHGFHVAEAELFRHLASELRLVPLGKDAYCRHPLAYLVEAADDICYRIVDLEDAVVEGVVPLGDAKNHLLALFESDERRQVRGRLDALSKAGATARQQIEYLRAKSISRSIFASFDSFKAAYDHIMVGDFQSDLIAQSAVAMAFAGLKDIARERVYSKASIVSIEVAGYEVLGGLLDSFAGAAHRLTSGQETRRDKLVLNLLNPRIHSILKEAENQGMYRKLLKITDFVSGMTDSYALDLFRRLKGITVHDGGRF